MGSRLEVRACVCGGGERDGFGLKVGDRVTGMVGCCGVTSIDFFIDKTY